MAVACAAKSADGLYGGGSGGDKPVGTIYGPDGREEIGEVDGRPEFADIRRRADAVVALFDRQYIVPSPAGYTIRLQTIEARYGYPLCEGERFHQQRVGPHCTGFLVAPDRLITSAHCFDQTELAGTYFVFGFEGVREDPIYEVPASDVFKSAGDSPVLSQGRWVSVQLERPSNRATVELKPADVPQHTEIYSLGHPLGLSLKYVGGARVLARSQNTYLTDLDAFGGMSGAPVFDAGAHRLIGFLEEGSDWMRPGPPFQSPCWRSVSPLGDAAAYVEIIQQ